MKSGAARQVQSKSTMNNNAVLEFFKKLLGDQNHFYLDLINIRAANNKMIPYLFVSDSYLYSIFLLRFLSAHGYKTVALYPPQDQRDTDSIPRNAIEMADAILFINDYSNDTRCIKQDWQASFPNYKRLIQRITAVNTIDQVECFDKDQIVLHCKLTHAGHAYEIMPILKMSELDDIKTDLDKVADRIISILKDGSDSFINAVDAALPFQKKLNEYPELFSCVIDQHLFMNIKSSIVAHHWHKDVSANKSTDNEATQHTVHIEFGNKIGLFTINESLINDLENYRIAAKRCTDLFQIASKHKMNARLRKSAQNAILLTIRDIAENYQAAFESASSDISSIFSPIILNALSINLSMTISDESWQAFIAKLKENFKVIEMLAKMKSISKNKAEQILTHHIGKADHDMNDYFKIGHAELVTLANRLMAQIDQEKINESIIQEKIKLLRQALKSLLEMGREIDRESNIEIAFQQLTSSPISRIPAMLNCLNIPGMIVYHDHIILMKDALLQLNKDLLLNLGQRLQNFLSCVNLLDNIICHLRDPNMLDPASKREDEQGFIFAFLNEEARLKFPAPDMLVACPGEVRLYQIPYSSCLDATGLLGKLKAAYATITSAKKPNKSATVDNKATRAVGYVNSPTVPHTAHKKSAKPDQSKQKAKAKMPKSQKSATTTTPAVSTAKTSLFKSKKSDLVQPAQRAANLNIASDGYVSVDLSKLHPEQAALADIVAPVIPISTDKPIMRHKYAHEGAIEYELTFLECSLAWYQKLEQCDDNFDRIFKYTGWLSEVRLFEAIYLRLLLTPECIHLSTNDKEAYEVRNRLVHGTPHACFINKLREYLVNCKFRLRLKDVFSGKSKDGNESFDFYLRAHFIADERPLLQLISESFDDLCHFIHHYDDKLRENGQREGEILKLLNNELITDITDLLVFEARAIQAVVVYLGELYRQADKDIIYQHFGNSIADFMRACVADRNIITHNNVFTATFDPVDLPSMLEQARKGASLWIKRENQHSPLSMSMAK